MRTYDTRRGSDSERAGAAVLALAGLAATVGCSGGTAWEPRSPDWTQRSQTAQQPSEATPTRYVVAVAEGATPTEAHMAACDRIMQQLGDLPADSEPHLRALCWIEHEGAGADDVVQVQAILDRQAATTALEQRARRRRRDLQETLARCHELVSEGRETRARQCVAWGDELRNEIQDLHAATRLVSARRPDNATLSEASRIEELRQRTQNAPPPPPDAARRTILVHVERYVDGALAGTANEPFVGLLRAEGLLVQEKPLDHHLVENALGDRPEAVETIAREAHAGYVLVGRLEARPGASEMGDHATGVDKLRLIDVTSGEVLAEISRGDGRTGPPLPPDAPAGVLEGTLLELRQRVSLWFEWEL